MSKIRYGKSSTALIMQKKSFFDENDYHIIKQKKIASVYLQQPLRLNCKNCNGKLNSVPDFVKNDIGYTICNRCSHLNGMHEDTNAFCESVYSTELSKQYAENYKSESIDDYNYRTSSIYIPKAEFLYTSLIENNYDPNSMQYIDFGAGSGYFVSALKKIGINNVKGYEVSKSQVELGNSMIGENILIHHSMADTLKIIRKTESQVVSLIGVLEHLQHPRELLQEIIINQNVKVIFLSVPTFSLSVFLEILNQNVYNRQLSAEHTHLYTEKSLSYLYNEFRLKPISEWWFGTDIVDLFRHMLTTLDLAECSEILKEHWKTVFTPLIDPIQLEIDKKKFSSEVHLILEKI